MEARIINKTNDGIETYELVGESGFSVQIINYGARLHRLFVPNRHGTPVDIIAGFDNVDDYRKENPYFNAIIGRVANRIEKGQFTLNDKTYFLYKNDGENCLHGGKSGFDDKLWQCEACAVANGIPSVILSYVSPDGEENFPGNMYIKITYSLIGSALRINYYAETDSETPFNPTNHAYFNLDGDFKSVLDHYVYINSDRITETDKNLIANGKLIDVKNTPFDFTTTKRIGRDLPHNHELIKTARGGYDFNYILNDDSCPAAYAYSEKSGIKMTVKTDRPCLQLYTGNFLDGSITGKAKFEYQSLFCMETQTYPNACNVHSFPSCCISPNKPFSSFTEYEFSIV